VGCSRAVEPFEPVLIKKRGKCRLPELRLPDDAEQRGCGLVLLSFQWRQNRGAFGLITIEGVGTGPQSKLDQRAPLGRGQGEMGYLMQDHVSFGSSIQCRSVPIEAAWGSFRVDRHTEAAREGERRQAMPLGLDPVGAVGRCRAD
jgi:hypothetical protein